MLLFRKARKKRARKRHRGGGGLAVPGPFKRIARAGGQKVTIRIAQRGVFANSSESFYLFFATAVTIRRRPMRVEILANRRCTAQACDPAWTAAVSLALRRCARTGFSQTHRPSSDRALDC